MTGDTITVHDSRLKPSRLFIHATNIHQGGGRALMDALLPAIPKGRETVLNLDERLPLPQGLGDNVSVRRNRPTVACRLLAEKWLADHAAEQDIVLCLGNLPPLFRLRARTVVFVQNRYLIDAVSLHGFPLRIRLRLALERFWLSARMENADELVVQTLTMKRLMENAARGRIHVRALPFVAAPRGYQRSLAPSGSGRNAEFDFVYVATGEPHKNHRHLILALCLLAEEGLFPTLCLTLDQTRFGGLCAEIDAMKDTKGIRVVNAGELPHADVLGLYEKAGALIYPSLFESFGMPLIEARQAGLPILASELDYVRDVVDPEQTFDPASPISIARAVKRFLGSAEQGVPLLDAHEFIRQVMEPDLAGSRAITRQTRRRA